MKLDICIPTMRPLDEIRPQIEAIERTAALPHRIIASCQVAYAAENRNFCLQAVASPIAVMLDDDIEGFAQTPGWDELLIAPFLEKAQRPELAVISARLMNPDGTVGPTCARNYDLTPDLIEIPPARDCIMPTAAIAFRNVGIRFDQAFVGSGWEDNDWMRQYLVRDPKSVFLMNNRCRLVHRNEMKRQGGKFWEHNRAYYRRKWQIHD
jgi:hypothetical protein